MRKTENFFYLINIPNQLKQEENELMYQFIAIVGDPTYSNSSDKMVDAFSGNTGTSNNNNASNPPSSLDISICWSILSEYLENYATFVVCKDLEEDTSFILL